MIFNFLFSHMLSDIDSSHNLMNQFNQLHMLKKLDNIFSTSNLTNEEQVVKCINIIMY